MISSANDIVRNGIPRRSATDDAVSVSALAYEPMIASGCTSSIKRAQASAAPAASEVLSRITSLIFAPPSEAMPPARLMSSAAISTPCSEVTPKAARLPVNGISTPTTHRRRFGGDRRDAGSRERGHDDRDQDPNEAAKSEHESLLQETSAGSRAGTTSKASAVSHASRSTVRKSPGTFASPTST